MQANRNCALACAEHVTIHSKGKLIIVIAFNNSTQKTMNPKKIIASSIMTIHRLLDRPSMLLVGSER